jgi:putative tributyrin esterase
MRKCRLIIFLSLFSVGIFAQDTLVFRAAYIPYADTTIVFTPAKYSDNNTYPLLIMLHGYSGNYSQWNDLTDLKKEADKDGFVIVCPDGFYRSWYLNSPVDSTMQYEKFFFTDLVPAIFNKYNIDKSNIFITGLSMGGHGAMYLFLRHPGFFKSAGSTSGILDIMPFPDNWELKNILGNQSQNKEIWHNHSDINLLGNIKRLNKKIIVDCGNDDFAFIVNKRFVEECRKNGIDVKYLTSPGDHNYEYWSKSILKHFEFFSSQVKSK